MNIIKTVKCLCCLIKCSKYIYYIKKALCIVTAVVALCAILGNAGKLKAVVCELKEM